MEKRLGKGLSALIAEDQSKTKDKIEKIQVTEIIPNPFQPRKHFEEEKMEDLIHSIKEKGVIQPIIVRPSNTGGYELIAGERRWRAVQKLQINEIPAIVRRDIDDANSLEISIIENIQRDELNAIEEANAYRGLIEQFEYTLEKIGQMVGKDKTTISNSLRLLNLSDSIKQKIEEGKISAGHAKALLSLVNEEKRERIASLIIKKGLSVRAVEGLVKTKDETKPVRKAKKSKDPETRHLEDHLQHHLGTKVSISKDKQGGKIEIHFYTNQDLQRLLGMILKREQ